MDDDREVHLKDALDKPEILHKEIISTRFHLKLNRFALLQLCEVRFKQWRTTLKMLL